MTTIMDKECIDNHTYGSHTHENIVGSTVALGLGSEGSKSYRVPLTLRYDLIPRIMLRRLAAIFEEGAKKYGEQKYTTHPMPFSVLLNHIDNHMNLYIIGDRQEDHLAKVIWGITAMIVLEEMADKGLLDDQNDLRPYGIQVKEQ